MDDPGRDSAILSAPAGQPAAASRSPAAVPAAAARRWPDGRARWLTVAAMIAGVVALLAVVWPSEGVALDVGQPGDRLFLAGVHGDERAAGRDYRWTRGTATLAVPGLGGADRLRLLLTGESGRPGGQAVPVAVSVDGVPAGTVELGAPGTAEFDIIRSHPTRDWSRIEITTPTFRPPADSRDLGLLLDRVSLQPVTTNWSLVATVERWARLAVLAVLLTAALWPARRWLPRGLLLALSLLIVAGLATLGRPWLLAGWWWLALTLGLAAAVVNHRRLEAAVGRGLRLLDRDRAWAATLALLVGGYALGMAALATQIEWIGHADYADNAVVARNLVAGRGYMVDYAAQFYQDYGPAISHPSDVWPLLQPTLIALVFLLLGPTTFAAKVPNILAMAALLALTGVVGRRLFGPAAGLAAAVVLALDGWYFQNSLFPVNDVPFALLTMALVALGSLAGRGGNGAGPDRSPWRQRASLVYAALGVVAGLTVLAKPGGMLVVGGLAAWWAWRAWRVPGVWPGWRWPAAVALIAALIVAPLPVRNVLTFGQPYYSLQSYDAWVTKWEPPDENIYRLFGGDLPHPRRLIGFGLDRGVEAVALQGRKLWTDLTSGNLFDLALLTLAAVGAVLGGPAVRRTLAALVAAAVPYLVFILVYWHYEERYIVWLAPWLCVLSAGGALGLLRWATASGDGGRRRLAAGLVLAGLLLLVIPRVDAITVQAGKLTPPAGDVIVGEWLAANTAPDAVVMTRVPWQTTWHSGRRTVMIPLAPADGIATVIRQYGVDYLVVNRLEAPSRRREALAPLYDGREALGFTRVRDFVNPLGQPYATLYRVPAALQEPGR